jgi:hypothetical protein
VEETLNGSQGLIVKITFIHSFRAVDLAFEGRHWLAVSHEPCVKMKVVASHFNVPGFKR